MVNLTPRHTNTQEKFSKINVSEVFLKRFRNMPKVKMLLNLWKDYFYDFNGKSETVVSFYNNRKKEGAGNKL